MNSPLRLGIAGLGSVGTSVFRLLQGCKGAQSHGCAPVIASVCARDRSRDRGVDLSGIGWSEDPVSLAASDEIDCFVELIGGDDGPALEAVEAALSAGKHVVTANKALLAAHGLRLAELAEKNGASLCFEAAVAGGIPIIKTLREALRGNTISRVYGILNGTCNYILTRMEQEGLTFQDCLSDAQRLGYAEADPTFDVEGLDTAHKLAILTSLAFGTRIDKGSIFVEGISSITPEDIVAANELGYRIKLLGVAQRTESGIEQRVHPTMVPKDSDIARISGVTNAVAVEGDFIGSVILSGPGAGGDATASAVAGDIFDLARGDMVAPLGRPVAELLPYKRARMRAHEGGYYLRLKLRDKPGAFATIARQMADADISLASIVQRSLSPQNSEQGGEFGDKTVTIITHDTTESAVRTALVGIEAAGQISQKPQMIRIEKL
ncbi:MAG TPA: homoserine dehydrogenase [Afifellaceae bacterium]|nr:homoserine dehydrogenase [Afifellaceae bacterium]